MLVRGQAEIGRVLVPGGEGRAVRLLDEKGRGVDEDVGPDQVLDHVEDARLPHQRIEPRQHDVAGRPPTPVRLIDRFAEPSFVARQAFVAFGQLLGRQRREREQVPVVAVLRDLGPGQHADLLACRRFCTKG